MNGHPFVNEDSRLREQVAQVVEERRVAGLDGLVGGLECVVINTGPGRQRPAAEELLRYTGYHVADLFQDPQTAICVLRAEGSADILVQSKQTSENPFSPFNLFPKSQHLPNTRLETFVFETSDLNCYVSIQKSRGVSFLTRDIMRADHYLFIQTAPSSLTGNSLGFIQWTGQRGNYRASTSSPLPWTLKKPDLPHLRNIGLLDHAATRVTAENRDPAILEFMRLTNYRFDFVFHVPTLNSITNVARLAGAPFALVFTSGIRPYDSEAESGPTEKFVHNYGPRTHHMAFATEHIEDTFLSLQRDGLGFLSDLVGSPKDGLKQAFSNPSENSLLVNEYIYRYGDFTGFFSQTNVTLLTLATAKQ